MAYPKRKCLISSGVPNELASAVRPMYSEQMISPVTSHSGPNQGATKEATNIKCTQRPRKPGLANTNVCKGPAMIKCWFVVAHVETGKIQKVHVGAKDSPKCSYKAFSESASVLRGIIPRAHRLGPLILIIGPNLHRTVSA